MWVRFYIGLLLESVYIISIYTDLNCTLVLGLDLFSFLEAGNYNNQI